MGMMEKIAEDLKAAMKSGDKIRLETLRTLRAVLMEKQIEKRGAKATMSPEDEVGVLMSAAKKRKESIEIFQKAGRNDLATQEEKELAIIKEYLPSQMPVEEVEKIVRLVANELGAASAADFGRVMPAVMKQLKGKADGKVIQDVVKKTLGAS